MKDRIRLLPPRSSTVGGPLLLVAGLAFLTLGIYYANVGGQSAQLLTALGFLSAGLGSTILIYIRRVSLRVIAEGKDEGKARRFHITVSEPGGKLVLGGNLTQSKELRVSPRSGPVLFVRLPDEINLELHRFASRRDATRQFSKLETLEEQCIIPARSEPIIPHTTKRVQRGLLLDRRNRMALWRDPIGVETALPLAVFLFGFLQLLILGLQWKLATPLNVAVFGLILSFCFLAGFLSSSVRYLRFEGSQLISGRILFRYNPRRELDPALTGGLFHHRRVIEEAGFWQLWREEVFPTAELRLYTESREPKPRRRIRLHSSLAASVAIYQCIVA